MTIDFTNPGTWVSLLTLSFLEVVLGIDNIIFISIITGKLPKASQTRIRNTGLFMAMVFRVCLLLGITWLIGLKDPVVTIPAIFGKEKGPLPLSYKDLILIAGGLFLLVKSTMEIHHKLQREVEGKGHKKEKKADR